MIELMHRYIFCYADRTEQTPGRTVLTMSPFSSTFQPWRLAVTRPLLTSILFVTALMAGFAIWQWGIKVSDAEPEPPQPVDSKPLILPLAKAEGPLLFRDVTSSTGVNFIYRTGEEADQLTVLETLGGGVVLIDFDRDGLLDIFLTGGGTFVGPKKTEINGLPCKLYRNLGNWMFQDVTSSVGLDGIAFYSHGGSVADYDRDGWPDLLVTGYKKLVLFRNTANPEGGRRFVDVTEQVGLKDESWSTSAAFADANGDGYPDLYVCHYVDWSFDNHPYCKGALPGVPRQMCPPEQFKPLVHAFFWNEGGKKFRNATAEQKFEAVGCGLGVVAADLNDDGKPDFFVGNDASNNQLFWNRGGRLEERGLSAGVALSDEGHYDGSMGVDVGDYDGKGRASIWVTNFQGDLHALYQNLGREIFQHRSRFAGIAAIGQQYVGFGTGFVDVDNDGWEDLVIANGHVIQKPVLSATYRQRPVLLHNQERNDRRYFIDISSRGGPFFKTPALGRGLAIGDLDNDGWPDLVVSHSNSPVALLRNVGAETIANPWVGLQLVGKDRRCIVGSTVKVQVGTRSFTRFVKSGGSYLSNSDSRLLVGLETADGPITVTVRWAWGQTETWTGLRPKHYWELREGTAALPATRIVPAQPN